MSEEPPRAAGGGELPPTLRDLLLVDAPEVLNRAEVKGGWPPPYDFVSFCALSSQRCRGGLALCLAAWDGASSCMEVSLLQHSGQSESLHAFKGLHVTPPPPC